MPRKKEYIDLTRKKRSKTLSKKVKDLTGAAATVSDVAFHKTAEILQKTGFEVSRLYDQRLGGRDKKILDDCPVVKSILEKREIYQNNPESFRLLYNVNYKLALIGGLGAAGIKMSEDTIARSTRSIFDTESGMGGWYKEILSEWIPADKIKEIDKYIDTVPGEKLPGGGVTHRVLHGHDLEGLMEVYEKYGWDGVAVWIQHVWGRDFFTSAGIPIAPARNEELFKFLTEQHGMGRAEAADWMSINFAEMLAGSFAVLALWRLWRMGKMIHQNYKVKSYCKQATELLEKGDYRGAVRNYEEALDIDKKQPHTYLFLGYAHLKDNRNRLKAHLAFQRAVDELAVEDSPLIVGAATFSLRGVAGLLALSTMDAFGHGKGYEQEFRQHVHDLAISTVESFDRMAYNLSDRRIIKWFGESSILPPRHFSAALNEYFSSKTAATAPFLENRQELIEKYTDRCMDKLEKVLQKYSAKRKSDEKISEQVSFMKEFIADELAPLPQAA